MVKKIGIILFFAAAVGAGHAAPLRGLPLLSDTAFAATQDDGQPCPPECVTDSMEIITYYPSPYGYYEELRGDKIIVGDTDNSHIDETHLPPSGTLTFEPKSYAQITTEGTLYEGTVYYDSFDHEFKYYDNNSSWQPLGGGGGDYWKPSEASGRSSSDIYYNWPGNVGIGVGASDTIGARLQVNPGYKQTGLIVRNGVAGSYVIWTRSASGAYSYLVPSGISSMRITVYGAEGCCGGYGGKGGMAQAIVTVTPGETLYVYVGGQGGYNGGGAGWRSGGGATDVRRGGAALANRIIVAGGGGGHAEENGKHPGGAGGGLTGGDGIGTYPGGGGGQGSGGGGGGGNQPGSPGTLGVGGGLTGAGGAGGGGGGGYYGGGGGGDSGDSGDQTSGGGGGSGYVTGSNTSMSSGVQSGDGKVVIDPLPSGSNSLTEWQDENKVVMNIVDMNGNLALGSSSANGYKLYVNGSAYVTSGAWTASDLRFKENILPLNNSLDKILNIQPVSFDWNKIGYPDMNFEQNRQIGLVAQEVEKEIPELVRTDTNGYKSIAYDKLTVVTIEAVKEQQKEIENQHQEIEQLKNLLKETSRKQQKEIELLKAEKKAGVR